MMFISRIQRLNKSNYQVWSTCVQSYLQGQDLWEVTNKGHTNHEPRIDTNGAITKRQVKVGKSMFSF